MITWGSTVHPLVAAIAAGAAVFLVHLGYRRLAPRTGRKRAGILAALRAAAFALVFLALFDPRWRPAGNSEHLRIAALLDVSSSMLVRDGKSARVDRANAILRELKRRLPGASELKVYEFDTSVRRVDADRRAAAQNQDDIRQTDLPAALRWMAANSDLSSYDALVLLSDGGDDPLNDPPAMPVPVHVVAIGSDLAGWKDVRVSEISAPATVEKGSRVVIRIDIAADSGDDPAFAASLKELPVILERFRDGAWVEQAVTNANLSNLRARARIETTCDEVGHFKYRARIPAQAGEISALNNIRTFSIEAVERAIHVLNYAREIGPDYKILRNILAGDAGIALASLYRTGGEKFVLEGTRLAGDEELNTGFPESPRTLALYDVVIAGPFPPGEWSPGQIAALGRYVEDGGALVLVLGRASFSDAAGPPAGIERLFPWTFGDPFKMAVGTFPVIVSPGAASHPIVAGCAEPIASEKQALLDEIYPGAIPRAGATVLLETRISGRTAPLAACHAYGRGRVLAFASNTFWKWSGLGGLLAESHSRLWRQAVRFLAGESGGGRIIRVTWDRPSYKPRETAAAFARVAGEAAASSNLTLRASLTTNGVTTDLSLRPAEGMAGSYAATVPVPEGDAIFELAASVQGKVLETYRKALYLESRPDEGSALAVDENPLRGLAARTQGVFLSEKDAASLADILIERAAAARAGGSGKSLVRSGPWYLLLFLTVLVIEWLLRRKANLP